LSPWFRERCTSARSISRDERTNQTGIDQVAVNGDPSTELRAAIGRLAGTVLRSELAGIRDVVLAVRGAAKDGSTAEPGSGSDKLSAFALSYIQYLEAVTEAKWGLRKEIERLLIGDPSRTSGLVFTPSTLRLAGAGRELAGAFTVENTGAATAQVELAYGAVSDAVSGEAIEGLRVELSPVTFEMRPGATVDVAVRASAAAEVPPGDYRTRLLSLRDLRWPVDVVIAWPGGEAAVGEPSPMPTERRRPGERDTFAPRRRVAHEPRAQKARPTAKASTGDKRRGRGRAAARRKPQRVDLATGTVEDFTRLDSVSPTVAAEMVATRQHLGGVLRVEDLLRVRGIGPKLAAKIADQVKPP
jgi:hypothetical protein